MAQEPTLEQLKEKLRKTEEERDQLKNELATSKASAVADWDLRQRVSIASIFNRPDGGAGLSGSTIGVAGWIKTHRMAAKDAIAFVKLNDGSHWDDIQIVVDKSIPGFETIKDHSATTAASIFVVGTIVISTGKGQKIELRAKDFRLLGSSDAATYPLSKKAHTVEFIRSVGHMRPRTQLINAVTKVRNALAFATHLYFQNKGYMYINTPIITCSDCEGAGEMFQVTTLLSKAQDKIEAVPKNAEGKVDYSKDFFSKPAFLTVSGQLNGEIYACALGSVYTFGPTFRAENSFTARHLAEFWMIEPEIAFADIYENMDVAEHYVRFVLKYALEKCPSELEFLEGYEKEEMANRKEEDEKKTTEAATAASTAASTVATGAGEEKEKGKGKEDKKDKKKQQQKDVRGFRLQPLRDRLRHVAFSDFARITYTEAIEILIAVKDKVWDVKPEWGIDLGSEHERWMAEEYFKKPVIVRNYPKGIKAFYMRLNEDGKTVAAMDVLVPGVGELIGGSQREERLEVLERRIEESKLEKEAYSWYLDLRRYGTVTHAGFGLGFERLVCYTTGVENIRESIPFPAMAWTC